MSSDPFLSDPSKKRKRGNRSSTVKKSNKGDAYSTPKGAVNDENDEEISGVSGSEDESGSEEYESADRALSSDEEFENETPADRRRRLAKQYLDNLKNEELGESNDEFFDAQDLDNDIISRRLQRDVAENRGQIYNFIADKVSSQLGEEIMKTTRIGSKNVTCLSICYPFMYTVSKDMELIKWDINSDKPKPKRLKHTKGGFNYFRLKENPSSNHHYDQINCVAASPDGKYVVTGGRDSRLIIWSTENLSCLKVIETRAAVNSIVFRRNTDQLFAACADLRVKTFSINQFAQLEVLYGHQDDITDISALARETCVSVGSRDKTALFWKIADESRLTFRGGDSGSSKKKKHDDNDDKSNEPFFIEGSIEVVSMNDESHFVTGSDNGKVSLWSTGKKKPIFSERSAHGLEKELTPSSASAEASEAQAIEQVPQPQPFWITSVHAIPFSDLFVTGSYNGSIKFWKIDKDGFRSFSLIGEVEGIRGCVVSIDSVEVKDNKKLYINVLTSKEHRFGRWLKKIEGARNAVVTFAFDI